MYIPGGIRIFEVRHDMTHAAQIGLFRKLRAQDADVGKVCRIILETHASEEFRPEKIDVTDLVSHVAFLLEAGWRIPEWQQTMWVLTQEGRLCRSSEVYLVSDQPHSASQILSKCHANPGFHFISRQYTENQVGVTTAEDQNEWLQANLNIAQLPRLITYADPEKVSFAISNDFHFLMDHCAMSVLQLLRLHWDHYRIWILTDGSRKADDEGSANAETSQGRLRDTVSSMMVSCRGSSMAKLRDTCLAPRSVLVGLGICDLGSNSESMLISGSADLASQAAGLQSNQEDAVDNLAEEFLSSSRLRQHTSGMTDHDSFSLLAVDDPEEQSWNFLETFGVTVQLTIHNTIGRLKQLVKTNAKKEQVTLLYDQIQFYAGKEDMSFIRCVYDLQFLVLY